MRVVSSLREIEGPGAEHPPLAITLGNFDGVHRGHQLLLRQLKDHTLPRKILHVASEGFLLCSETQKRRWMAEAGVDWLVEIPFTRDLSTLGAQEFLDRHILIYPQLKEIYLGWDFAFGAHKSAGAEDVRARCEGMQIKVEICPRFDVGNLHVSSTRIREALATGDVAIARELLGRPYTLEGLVVKGEGRGRRIGVPTANLRLDEDLMLPRRGVYVTETASRGMIYRSVTNVGLNPTFQETNRPVVETNILDFDGDIYGETIEVRFLARLRDERRFASVEELVTQIHLDREKARAHSAG